MAAICRSYDSHAEAQEAVRASLAAGVPGGRVRVLMGQPIRDAHAEQVGEFAGPTGPDAPVGTFAGEVHPQSAVAGTFAGGQQRGGSFGDADRELLSTYPDGVEKVHVTSHGHVKRLLTDAGLDEATAERDIEALHAGRVLVLVEAAEG